MLAVLPLVPVVQQQNPVPLKAFIVAIFVFIPEVIGQVLHILLPVRGAQAILFHGRPALHGLADRHQNDINMMPLFHPRYVFPQIRFLRIRKHIRVVIYALRRSLMIRPGHVFLSDFHNDTGQGKNADCYEPEAKEVQVLSSCHLFKVFLYGIPLIHGMSLFHFIPPS